MGKKSNDPWNVKEDGQRNKDEAVGWKHAEKDSSWQGKDSKHNQNSGHNGRGWNNGAWDTWENTKAASENKVDDGLWDNWNTTGKAAANKATAQADAPWESWENFSKTASAKDDRWNQKDNDAAWGNDRRAKRNVKGW